MQMNKNNLPYRKNPGFSVPPNYFEELENELFDMVTNNEVSQESNLSKIEKSGFIVPENYFANLEGDILKKLDAEPKVVSLFNKENLLYAASIAAIFIALAGVFFLNPPNTATWDDIEVSVLESYIDDNNINFSTPEISSFLFEDGIFLEEPDFTEVNADVMFDYLDENVEDPDYILD